MSDTQYVDRRTVLKTTGGLLSLASVSGVATAKGNNYGGGNGLGAFLNDEAEFKDDPVWDSGIADMTGQSAVDVIVGTLTSIDIPEEIFPGGDPPEQGPFGFEPRAVKVSPGTEVTWTWTSHHSVTSYNESAASPKDHGQLFDSHGERGHTFSHTFEDVGNYLYYCHPHGTPYPLELPDPVGKVDNIFGMRGAVQVADD